MKKPQKALTANVCTVTNACNIHGYEFTVFFISSVSQPNMPTATIKASKNNHENTQINEVRIKTLKEPVKGELLIFNDHKDPYIIGEDSITKHPQKVWVQKEIEFENNFIKQITIDDPQV